MRRCFYFFCIFFIIIQTFGCSRHSAHKENDDQILENNTSESPQNQRSDYPVLDLNIFSEQEEEISLINTNRAALSKFPVVDESQIIRVSVNLRGFPKSQNDDIEEHIWKLIEERAPQPWELRNSALLDKNDTTYANINIDVSRKITKLRRGTKTAPMRYENKYAVKISIALPSGISSSWSNWNYSRIDEVTTINEKSVRALFWSELNEKLPALTIYSSEAANDWMRSQDLIPQIIDNSLSSIELPEHRIFNTGCLVSRKDARSHEMRMLQSPHSVAQFIDISNIIDMACTQDAIYVASQETPVRAALYYQPLRATHAWKSLFNFSDSIDNLKMHIDDDLICLYSGMQKQARASEIQCIDRNTGLIRWKTKRIAGAIRAIAFNKEEIALVTDKAAYAIYRNGTLRKAIKIQNSSKIRDIFSCQLQNRLIFMTDNGQFHAWNIENLSFDWQATTLEPNYIHCGLNHTLLISDTSGYILAFDVENNHPLWKYRAVSMPIDTLSIGENIYLLKERAIIVLDRTTGQIKLQIPLPWNAKSFIQIGHKIYIDTINRVYSWR